MRDIGAACCNLAHTELYADEPDLDRAECCAEESISIVPGLGDVRDLSAVVAPDLALAGAPRQSTQRIRDVSAR